MDLGAYKDLDRDSMATGNTFEVRWISNRDLEEVGGMFGIGELSYGDLRKEPGL